MVTEDLVFKMKTFKQFTSEGIFADPKLNKKYPDQPKMTEKGKKILPNLPDPEGMGSTKTSKRPFGISKSTNDALKMLK